MTDALTIPERLAKLRATFRSGRTKAPAWRVEQLRGLQTLVRNHETDLAAALHKDLGKSVFEAYLSESGFIDQEVTHTLKNLAAWIRPRKVSTPLITQPSTGYTIPEPYGVALIIGPWNYPLHLILVPLAGALAAGNCALLKPSEIAPACSATLADLVSRYIDPEAVAVVEGGVPETTELLAQRFDTLFYTGSATVGRIVMKAAAEHLTPLTLELGGKSPCVIDETADLSDAARRVVWGRFFNAGQTCVAPDYVLVPRSLEAKLLKLMSASVKQFYGSKPQENPDYGRIVNRKHFDRICKFLEGGSVVVGGEKDPDALYIAPTILTEVDLESPTMKEEIFGPVLPVIPVDDLDAAIAFVNERPKPLSLYLFAGRKSTVDRVVSDTSSGSVCINDVILQYAASNLPFGGVGESGFGAYHGQATFEAFSHRKSVLKKHLGAWEPALRFPPYSESKLRWLRRLAGTPNP